MIDWEKVKLVEVADVKLSNVDKKTKEGERSVRLCNYTDVYKNSYINEGKAKKFMVASCNENEYQKFLLQEGQVAITKDSEKRDDIGVPTYISEDLQDVVLGYHLSLITPINSKLNGSFLNYWLNTKQAKRYFENNASGSGQRCTLPLDIIKSIPLYLPNISTQKQIAKTLSVIDTKIELNTKINEKLEVMAKLIYDYWFVQFDFPDEHGKPYKSSGGKMVFNEELKREIPEGWEVKELNELCSRIGDGIHGTPKYVDSSKYSFINGNNLKNGFVQIKNDTKKVSKEVYLKHFINLDENSILLSINGTLGNLASYNGENIMLGKSSAYINCENGYKSYCFQFLGQEHIQKLFWKIATGSTIKNLSLKSIKELNVILPSKSILTKIDSILSSINKKKKLNFKENQTLSSLRDWLLPMLMNGQVKVGG